MNDSQTQFLSTREAITEWLNEYNIENYMIHDDLSVDVKGHVNISHQKLKVIPINFGSIANGFYCHKNKLTNLIGSPKYVGGDFWCQENKLTSLAGAPKYVRQNFYCGHNKLLNLTGSPKSVGGVFNCGNNQLISLVGVPKTVDDNFFCLNNPLISLLELVNCKFNGDIIFNIDETNFQPKELIQILKKNYDKYQKYYILNAIDFHATIKPQIEKEILQQKINKSKAKIQIKASFL